MTGQRRDEAEVLLSAVVEVLEREATTDGRQWTEAERAAYEAGGGWSEGRAAVRRLRAREIIAAAYPIIAAAVAEQIAQRIEASNYSLATDRLSLGISKGKRRAAAAAREYGKEVAR